MTGVRPLTAEDTVFVAGGRGLVGRALLRCLAQRGVERVLAPPRQELDLRDPVAVARWFSTHRPTVVLMAAGTVGGILANAERPAEFLRDNLAMAVAVVDAAHQHGVRRLLYLGSSCIYPRDAPQPMAEECLLTGPLEQTNEGYALAKISGIKLCQTYRRQYGCDFIAAMPTNLYGSGDNFSAEGSHVIPGMMRRFYEARERGERRLVVWGSGRVRREFLHVDDLADACLFLLDRYSGESHVNVGTGVDVTIQELAEAMRELVAPGLEIEFDPSKPDGTPRKLLDCSRIHAMGWKARISLRVGLRQTYEWFQDALGKGAVRL